MNRTKSTKGSINGSMKFTDRKNKSALAKFISDTNKIEEIIKSIRDGKFVIIYIVNCDESVRAMTMIETQEHLFCDVTSFRLGMFTALKEHAKEFDFDPKYKSVPTVFNKGKFIGGEIELANYCISKIMKLIDDGGFVILYINGCDESDRAMKLVKAKCFNVRHYRKNIFQLLEKHADKLKYDVKFTSVPTVFYQGKFIGGELELIDHQINNILRSIRNNEYVILYVDDCAYCERAMMMVENESHDIGLFRSKMFEALTANASEFDYKTSHTSVPVIFKNGKFIGGESDLRVFLKE